jgi:hypothetical protein
VGVIEGISLFTDAKQAADENRAVKDTSEVERLIGGNITPGIVEQVAVPKPQSLVTLRAAFTAPCCKLVLAQACVATGRFFFSTMSARDILCKIESVTVRNMTVWLQTAVKPSLS